VEKAKGKNSADFSEIIFSVVVILSSIIAFIVVAYPIYFILIASISDANLVHQGQVTLLPKKVNLYGYNQIFNDPRIWIGYRNTIFYTFAGTFLNLVVTLPAAYTLSRKDFKHRRIIMSIFVFTMFFNGGMIPTYLLVKNLGLVDTPWIMVIMGAVNVYNLIIVRTYFETSVPVELYEAAVLDGCSHFRHFFTIVLPLSKAVISVIFLYYMVGHWNDFFNGLLYINSDSLQPLQVVLRNILLANEAFKGGVASGAGSGMGSYAQRYADQVKFAVIIVSTLPVVCIYPFIQKYFEVGVMIGAIKG